MLARIIADAKDRFWIIGLKNSRLANLQVEILHQLQVNSSLKMRILFLDWRSPSTVLDFYQQCVQTPGQSFSHTIESHNALFTGNRSTYKELWGGRLDIRAYSDFPVYPLIIADDRVFLGMYVRNAPERATSTYNSPYLEVPQSASLGRLALSQFEAVWLKSRCLCRPEDVVGWVIFDLDNTLYDSPEMSYAYEQCAIELFAASTKQNYRVAHSTWNAQKEELAQRKGYLPAPREILRNADLPMDYWALVTRKIDPRHYLHLDAELQALLAQISCVRRIGLLTNNSRFQAEATLDALGVRAFFDEIICADEVGGLKPDEVVFSSALKKTTARPEDIVMVGDNMALDLLAAKNLGMRVLQLKRTNLRNVLDEL
jgi:FMN phosphatase YigB (HAD superfamily)